jgi:fluoride exporter
VTSLGLVGLVAAGGAAGSVLRWAAERRVTASAPGGVPAGTLVVNVAGSALLGLLVGLDAPTGVLALLGTGLCGGVTTFSGICLQAVEVGRLSPRRAARYGAATLALGLVAATLGWLVGKYVT